MKKEQGAVFDKGRNPLTGINLAVYDKGTIIPSTIFDDEGVTPKANPFALDSLGRFAFYAPDGKYDLEWSGAGIVTIQMLDHLIVDSAKSPFLNVKALGARGDGITDDTTAIQNAINNLPTLGGTLFFPSGIYNISSLTLHHAYPVAIRGEGIGITYLRTNAATGNVITISMNALVKMKDLTLDVKAGVTRTADTAIYVDGWDGSGQNDGSRFEDIMIYEHFQGIYFKDATSWRVSGANIRESKNADIIVRNTVNPDNGGGIVSNSILVSSILTLGSIVQYGGGGLKIFGNAIANPANGIILDIVDGTTVDLLVSGNTIEGIGATPAYGILLKRSSGAYIFSNIVMVGNEIAQWQTAQLKQESAGFKNMTISGNVFGLNVANSKGVHLDGVIGAMVGGNAFRGCNNGDHGIEVSSNCADVLIGPNQYEGVAVNCINASTTSGFYIHDRGDPSAFDWLTAGLTKDGSWHDLDCSAIVPPGARFIHFRVVGQSASASGNIWVRKKGNSNSYAIQVGRVNYAGDLFDKEMRVPCSQARVVEYITSVITWDTLSIAVIGWDY